MQEKVIKREVFFDALKPGMKLITPILDDNGRVLVPKDTILTDKIIEKTREFFDGFNDTNRYWIEEKIYIRSQEEEKYELLKQRIADRFKPYQNNHFYQFLENFSLKAFDYLIKKCPELYEK
ncbi:MAG TPA: hypothetical protein PLJ38_07065 [bacterium]|nr:hypothetical protein [bacterium]